MPPVYEGKYEVTIGLEVHAQLNTKSKIFCGCNTAFGAQPNTQVCPVCLGLPGVLPVLNQEVLKKAVLAGLATNSRINRFSKFDRKQYFYPDLPKAYQISQYEQPICLDGELQIIDDEGKPKRIGITRIHMEEDAGKLVHSEDKSLPLSYIDLNRTGVPLIEIVSEPEIQSPLEAYNYLTNLKAILRYADISDGNMEEGSLRCDANVSIKPVGATKLGTRCEIKNLNSFKNVKASIEYEISRQIAMVEAGESVRQETRLWNADEGRTRTMRSKDDAHDYRYFPDPDLVPIVLSEEEIEKIRDLLPELPQQKSSRFQQQYSLPEYDATVLTATRETGEYYEQVVAGGIPPKKASNWIMSEVLYLLKENSWEMSEFPVKAEATAKLLQLVESGTISGKIAKKVFDKMVAGEGDPDQIVAREGLVQVSDTAAIEAVIQEVLSENQDQVEEYRSGKEKVFGFLVGQVMKKSKGKANPQVANDLLKKALSN